MKTNWFASVCLPFFLAATGPVPLVTGAVRDQFGDPISGALVSAGTDTTTTDSAGTFALETQTASVKISCSYCRTTIAAVANDGTVAAIVERYRAVETQNVTAADVRALPYAHLESAISLQPFIVLTDSSNVVPGPRISFYGISQFGGLLVDNGIPSYDITAGATALRSMPSFGKPSVDIGTPGDSFRYGDMSAGGSFFVRSDAAVGSAASLLGGSERSFDATQNLHGIAYTAAISGDGSDTRTRADGSILFAQNDTTYSLGVLGARDRYDNSPLGIADSSATGVRLHVDRVRAVHSYADVTADRDGYSVLSASRIPVSWQWSDVSFQTGVSTQTPVSTFADFGTRFSTGYYDASALDGTWVAGTIAQVHVSAGAKGHTDRLAWQAGVGGFNVWYAGGTHGRSHPLSTEIASPFASIAYDITPQWNLQLDAGQSFRLPTLVEAYAYGADVKEFSFDRYAIRTATLTYTDRRRLHISAVGMDTHVSSLDNGTISAAGASFSWQIAPTLSLRAWALHFDDASHPYARVFRFNVVPQPATPAAIWLSYENPHGIRTDAILRRDLIDYRTDMHFDASISGPISQGWRWFTGTEERGGTRYVTGGLRFEHP